MEDKQQDFEIQESNATRKMKALGVDMDEKIHSKEDEITKGNLWDNIWYRYKWVIIVGSILLVIAIILIVQVAIKKEDDVKIAYAGPAYVANSTTREGLHSIFSTIAKDYNKDDNLIVNLNANVIYNSIQQAEKDEEEKGTNADQRYQNQQMLNTFSQQMMSGDFAIYFLDPVLYEENFNGLFRSIEDAVGLDIDDEIMYDKCSFYLKKTEFGKYFKGLDTLPDNTIVLILNKTAFAKDDEYNNSIDFVREMLLYKAPQ